jgi:hypothetical protein
MTTPVRCRQCGALFIPEHPLLRVGPWRYCPRCRGPLPPNGTVIPEGLIGCEPFAVIRGGVW